MLFLIVVVLELFMVEILFNGEDDVWDCCEE